MLVGRDAENRETSFCWATSGTAETFHWIDSSFAHAVTAEVCRNVRQDVAEELYSPFPA